MIELAKRKDGLSARLKYMEPGFVSFLWHRLLWDWTNHFDI